MSWRCCGYMASAGWLQTFNSAGTCCVAMPPRSLTPEPFICPARYGMHLAAALHAFQLH